MSKTQHFGWFLSRGFGPHDLAVTAPQPARAARSSRLAVVPQMPLARTSGVGSV